MDMEQQVTKKEKKKSGQPGWLVIFMAFKTQIGTSLVVQWLRTHLPMQGHMFEPWSWKIPHAAEQLSPCATTTEPVHHTYRGCAPQLPKPVCLEPMLRNKRSHRNEKPTQGNEE